MSSIVNSITGSGGQGSGFQAQSANILNPSTTQQATDQYGNAQIGLANQQGFLNALQGQNGIGNQSNVFNQLQGVANGTGPNPAQAMLNQSTGANTANQAALMAGQRGSSANTGLIARQAAQQGGANQQNAAGQAANLQAQQSLGALGQLGGIAGQQVTNQAGATNAYSQAAQGEQANILNGIAQQNNANVGMQSNINNANAGLAQIGAQGSNQLLGGLLNGVGLGAATATAKAKGGLITKPKMANGGETPSYGGVTAPTPLPENNLPTPNAATGGGAGSGLGGLLSGAVNGVISKGVGQLGQGIWSGLGDVASGLGIGTGGSAGLGAMAGGAGDAVAGGGAADAVLLAANGGQIPNGPRSRIGQHCAKNKPHLQMAKGGPVPAMVSPGEKYLSPQAVQQVKAGASPMFIGETIPGQPKVDGNKNSYANDTVPKTLESGGIVLPRSVTQSKNAEAKAAKFVHAIMAKNSLPKSKK